MDRFGETPRLGQLLLRAGALDEASLARGLAAQERNGRPLGMTLVELGLLNEQTLVTTLAHQLGLPVAHIGSWPLDPEVVELVPAEISEKHRCLPLALKQDGAERSVYLAMVDPSDLEAIEAVRALTGREVRVVLAAPTELEAALARCRPRGLALLEADAPLAPSGRAAPPTPPSPAAKPPSADALHRWSVTREELMALLADDAATPAAPPASESASELRAQLDRRRLDELDGMVRLLMQLLIDGGVVSRDELVRRLSELVHERR